MMRRMKMRMMKKRGKENNNNYKDNNYWHKYINIMTKIKKKDNNEFYIINYNNKA